MGSMALVKRALAPAWVRPEALNVTPDLLGAPLAPHGRRALAMGVDVTVIGLLSATGMFWIVAGIGALLVQLRRPPPNRPRSRGVLMWAALALLIVLAVSHGQRWVEHRDDPPRAESAQDDDDDAVAATIAASGANVLLAGLGSPKQEWWLEKNLAATGCAVGIGVGGSFDVLAGTKRRAPLLVQRLGLEWLFRLVQEPSRWRRQLALPQFAFAAAREAFSHRGSIER